MRRKYTFSLDPVVIEEARRQCDDFIPLSRFVERAIEKAVEKGVTK
jgi:hypothetical protein